MEGEIGWEERKEGEGVGGERERERERRGGARERERGMKGERVRASYGLYYMSCKVWNHFM
jgi:hypothetical protein